MRDNLSSRVLTVQHHICSSDGRNTYSKCYHIFHFSESLHTKNVWWTSLYAHWDEPIFPIQWRYFLKYPVSCQKLTEIEINLSAATNHPNTDFSDDAVRPVTLCTTLHLVNISCMKICNFKLISLKLIHTYFSPDWRCPHCSLKYIPPLVWNRNVLRNLFAL